RAERSHLVRRERTAAHARAVAARARGRDAVEPGRRGRGRSSAAIAAGACWVAKTSAVASLARIVQSSHAEVLTMRWALLSGCLLAPLVVGCGGSAQNPSGPSSAGGTLNVMLRDSPFT